MLSYKDLRYNEGQMKTKKFTSQDVAKIAGLAHLPVTPKEEQTLSEGFNTTIEVVDQLFAVDVAHVESTSQVTGLTNVFREDSIDSTRMLTQEQALTNAKRTYNGFFVVDQILAE